MKSCAYLEMVVNEKMQHGMSRNQALRAVRLERGSLEGAKETVRGAGWESLLERFCGSPLWIPHAAPIARFYGSRRDYPGVGHWSEYGHLQLRLRDVACAIAISKC
jgi:hypothetical protein